ncbi:MAG: GTPase RsgA [Ilumatobacteraceae bacterium]
MEPDRARLERRPRRVVARHRLAGVARARLADRPGLEHRDAPRRRRRADPYPQPVRRRRRRRLGGALARHRSVDHIVDRTSAFAPRSHDGDRFEADVLAANIDVVFLVHALGAPPNQRRLERELVLAYDSGAEPVVVLTKVDLVADPEPTRRELADVALARPCWWRAGSRSLGIDPIRACAIGEPDARVPRCVRCRQVDPGERPPRP